MDCRLTIGEGETFLEMLTDCMRENRRVEMIVDEGGLDRAGGVVKSIYTCDGRDMLELENGQKIEIASVVAVNGIFAASYAGC